MENLKVRFDQVFVFNFASLFICLIIYLFRISTFGQVFNLESFLINYTLTTLITSFLLAIAGRLNNE